MHTLNRLIYLLFIWSLVVTMILFYPMFISIYVFLPLFIGLFGYILIIGIEKQKWHYILISVIYFINVETNLSLPLFLMTLSSLLVYMLFYTKLTQMKWCRVCAKILLVTLLNLVCLGALLGYDFIFETTSVGLDILLVYSLLIDIVAVMVL